MNEILIVSIISIINSVCTNELSVEDCEIKLNKCLDKKVWEYREYYSEPDDEMKQILLNECIDKYLQRRDK